MQSNNYTDGNEWQIEENSLELDRYATNESIFSLANGHIGLRGNLEECRDNLSMGTLINGFYETSPIHYGESAYGFAKDHQTIIPVADGRFFNIAADGISLDLKNSKIVDYRRTLDMQSGTVVRKITWEVRENAFLEIEFVRLVSLTQRHLAAIEIRLKPVNGNFKEIRIDSFLYSSITATTKKSGKNDPRVKGHDWQGSPFEELKAEVKNTGGHLHMRTKNSRQWLSCAVEHAIKGEAACETSEGENCQWSFIFTKGLESGISLTKYLSYYTSHQDRVEEDIAEATHCVNGANSTGFQALLAQQQAYLDEFWSVADLKIGGDLAQQQSIRFNIFSLLQSAGRDGYTNVAAKGLSGEGYEGHYFWDTEIYIIPFFCYNKPDIARALIQFRCNTLQQAKERAEELSHKGALYPWRTIGGTEASAYFPAGTAQYHINAAIAYALKKYLDATGDNTILLEGGAEMLFETARFWLSLGNFSKDKAHFYINCVTGPDEYTALINNNCYTNLMAQFHLRFAVDVTEMLTKEQPAEMAKLIDAIGLNKEEVEEWYLAAEKMYIPFDAELGIHAQDDSFLQKEIWDIASIPEDKKPLLLHFHPLDIYRRQILKQPDLVLAMFLLDKSCNLAQKRRNFDYYNPLTTGDSSLAASVQSIATCELGRVEEAYEYFVSSSRVDLDNSKGNSGDGIHLASMAGSWNAIVYGFGGLRDVSGKLSFQPRLPSQWDSCCFSLTYRGNILRVKIEQESVSYELIDGSGIEFQHENENVSLVKGECKSFSLIATLKAVIFDLDGVLTDTADLHHKAWKELCQDKGLTFFSELEDKLRGISRIDSIRLICEANGKVYSDQELNSLAAEKNDIYRKMISTITPADLFAGVKELLQSLRKNGIKVGLASASKNAGTILSLLEIENEFDFVADAGKICKGKPDPEIFLEVANALGIMPRDCVGVEDAQAGIDAINAGGMSSVGIGGHLHSAVICVDQTGQLDIATLQMTKG